MSRKRIEIGGFAKSRLELDKKLHAALFHKVNDIFFDNVDEYHRLINGEIAITLRVNGDVVDCDIQEVDFGQADYD